MSITNGIALNAGNKVVNSVFETWLLPKAKRFKDEFKQIFDLNFKDYLNRMYNDSKYINSLIFSKIPKEIEELYVPLKLNTEIQEESINIFYPKEIKEFIDTYKNILIVDTAGMGKSTLLKWMFKKSIELNNGIPIIIELRKLNKEHTILDEINKGINGFSNNIDNGFLEKLIEKGNFIFYLDGFDEIASNELAFVTQNLQEFISKAYMNRFIISSRPNDSLNSFNNFYTFQIEKIEIETTKLLLRKYANADKSIDNTEELIKELERRQYELNDFIETPLMVALLYKGYDYRKNIPVKKSIFYRQVYDALFQDHDMSKPGTFSRQKKSLLDIEDFHTLLNSLGYITFKLGLIAFNKEDLISYIEQAIQLSEIEAPVLGVIEDLTETVSLMHIDGNEYVWNHKSLQEYFAAKFICLDALNEQEKILNSMYNTREFYKYETLLSLCFEIKPQLFKKNIIKKFLTEVIEYYESFEIENSKCNDSRKLLRKLVFNSSYILAVFKKDYIKELYKEEWNEQLEPPMENEDKEATKYRHFSFGHVLGYIEEYKLFDSQGISATIIEYQDNIIVIAKHDRELKALMRILYTKNEEYISKKIEDINIPKYNLDFLINSIIKDENEVWIDVYNDDIDEESFPEELVNNILSIIYESIGPISYFVDYKIAKESLSLIENKTVKKELFEF